MAHLISAQTRRSAFGNRYGTIPRTGTAPRKGHRIPDSFRSDPLLLPYSFASRPVGSTYLALLWYY